MSERAVAGALRFPVEKTPLLLPRLLSLSPCRSSGPGLIHRRHLGEWTDIIGGTASGVTTRSCEGWVWWSRFVRLGFDSGRWRLLKLHRRRPCFREMEASLALLSPALVSWGWRCSLPCVAGSWSPISVLGFFYLCFCGFGLVLMEDLSSEDDWRSPVVYGDGLCQSIQNNHFCYKIHWISNAISFIWLF